MEAHLLSASQIALLGHLAKVEGCDIYNYGDAVDGRRLEAAGLVAIVKAVNPPKNGAARQPYYGVAITAAGRDILAAAHGARVAA